MFKSPDLMDTNELVDLLVEANEAYRRGSPILSDGDYDTCIKELTRREPEHPFLNAVEPEPVKFGRRITHQEPMRSTEKAYEEGEVRAFIKRAQEAALDVGVDPNTLLFHVTPKLDGQAGHHQSAGGVMRMVTRGDGLHGNDISHIQSKLRLYHEKNALIDGLLLSDELANELGGLGAGEIVIEQAYFEAEIKHQYGMSHPRNFVAGMTDADELKPHHLKALKDGKVFFAPFSGLNAQRINAEELRKTALSLPGWGRQATPFATDGVVLRVDNEAVQQAMGATNKANRWMLAIKEEGDSAEVEVLSITAQVGRTGQITPVLELRPTDLSGAIISRVTAHNLKTVEELGLGAGAIIKLVRSGEVIPYMAGVIKPADQAVHLAACPCCGSAVVSQGENSYCSSGPGVCRDQAEAIIAHYVDTMQNIDLFGESTIKSLHNAGYKTLLDLMTLSKEGAMRAGFSERQAENLMTQLQRSRTEPVEDWRFLAAFGIPNLGRGAAKRLLQNHPLHTLPNLSVEDVMQIEGFGSITAGVIVQEIKERWPQIEEVMSYGVNLVVSRSAASLGDTLGGGRKIVFTGTLGMPRKDAQKLAEDAGFIAASAVSAGCVLVTGDKVGAKKIGDAEKKGATVIDEAEFLRLIGQSRPQGDLRAAL